MPPSKINILEAVDRKVKEVFHPFIVGDVNDSQVKVAKFAMASQKWAKVILSWSRAGSNTGLGRFRGSPSF
jgi:hypothetical protein